MAANPRCGVPDSPPATVHVHALPQLSRRGGSPTSGISARAVPSSASACCHASVPLSRARSRSARAMPRQSGDRSFTGAPLARTFRLIISTPIEKAIAKYVYPLGMCTPSASATRFAPIMIRKASASTLMVG